MRQHALVIVLGLLLAASAVYPQLSQSQNTDVYAEALGQANLRARPDVNSDLVGEIAAGVRYPVIGRSEFFPWLLLGQPDTFAPLGWVFQDLASVTGDLQRVPFTDTDVTRAPDPTHTPTVSSGPAAQGGNLEPGVQATTASVTPTATLSASVTGAVQNEINIRYGPGVDYPVLARAFAGEVFEVTAYHTQFPWLQVRFDASPTGSAWIATDLLEIRGDLFSLPTISTLDFNFPALTPTPAIRQVSDLPGLAPEISPAFAALGDRIWNIILDAGFQLESSRFGAVYLEDLQTGETITFANDIAFSGTSVNKIAILLEYFATLDGHPNGPEAIDVANTMICSTNEATNRLLGIVGSGDQILGAEQTTQLMRDIGLENTFLTAPFEIPSTLPPTPPPRAITAPQTDADQVRAEPNPTNQLTVDELGYFLGAVYDCAYNENGPLIGAAEDRLTPQECRKALHVMSNNTVDALLRAGVPAETRVAHKHGWINDTHGNAAIIFSPGGDYVLVMMLHQPDFLDFNESLPLIAEVSREVYNYFNADAPMPAIREGYIPTVDECNYTFDDPLVGDIASPFYLDLNDPALFFNPQADTSSP